MHTTGSEKLDSLFRDFDENTRRTMTLVMDDKKDHRLFRQRIADHEIRFSSPDGDFDVNSVPRPFGPGTIGWIYREGELFTEIAWVVDAGQITGPHRHDFQEDFYVLKGTVWQIIGDGPRLEYGMGSHFTVPPNVVHTGGTLQDSVLVTTTPRLP